MNVGFVGLGKLGLPVAAAIASRGIDVYGYDLREPDIEGARAHEDGFGELYEQGRRHLHITPLEDVVANCETIFCAVQTPHEPRYEGVTPIPDERVDFDYSYLVRAVRDLVRAAEGQGRRITLAIISTVLPGTMARYVEPILGPNVDSLVYNPSFIAMGTTVRDFLDPEFVLIGGDDEGRVQAVYDAVLGEATYFCHMSVESAELTKVAYNTFIGLKIAFANTLLEICEKTDGTDVDEVTGALAKAHRRLISPAYLAAGMGDGGGCHPRDNIALSWLARELDLGYDLFEATMLQRERQAEWLAEWMRQLARVRELPLGILGIAYKPSSHLTTGSHPRLVKNLLERRGEAVYVHDPHVDGYRAAPHRPHIFLVGCRHPEFEQMQLPAGSVVIDPWRYMPKQDGVTVISVGK